MSPGRIKPVEPRSMTTALFTATPAGAFVPCQIAMIFPSRTRTFPLRRIVPVASIVTTVPRNQHQFNAFPNSARCAFSQRVQIVRLGGMNSGLYMDFIDGALRERRRDVQNHGYGNEPDAE